MELGDKLVDLVLLGFALEFAVEDTRDLGLGCVVSFLRFRVDELERGAVVARIARSATISPMTGANLKPCPEHADTRMI